MLHTLTMKNARELVAQLRDARKMIRRLPPETQPMTAKKPPRFQKKTEAARQPTAQPIAA